MELSKNAVNINSSKVYELKGDFYNWFAKNTFLEVIFMQKIEFEEFKNRKKHFEIEKVDFKVKKINLKSKKNFLPPNRFEKF